MESGPRVVISYSSSGMRKPGPTDLSDAQWNYIEPHLPAPKGYGRPRIHDLREIFSDGLSVRQAAEAVRARNLILGDQSAMKFEGVDVFFREFQ
jgi:hypothetical protein